MIADRDIYADKDGKLTDDPDKYASQVAVKGCHLDERIARRFGIADTLVSTMEPHAVRRVTGRNASSVQITKAAEPEATPAETPEPQEPAGADEPTVDEPKAAEPKAEATKPAAKKGEQKK